MEELTERQKSILRIIVQEYVRTATPVPSEAIPSRYRLGVSPATVRNEMAVLEEKGYISHPHTSAGRVPTDKGYRYFVESLMGEAELPIAERLKIQHQFHQIELEQEEWLHLAAAVLAQAVHNAAVITPPLAAQARFKHLELIAVHDLLALLVLVLQDGTIKQQMLTLSEPMPQEELSPLANKLNASCAGLSREQIAAQDGELTPLERQVTTIILHLMRQLDEKTSSEVYHNGLAYALEQPEFQQAGKAQQVLEVLEQRSLLATVLGQLLLSRPGEPGVQVFIGQENPWDELRDYSLVLAPYGLLDEMSGVLGVLGPTRLPYWRAISSVRYMAVILSTLLGEMYG
jgi:heat-inducible transcriptional repressor